MKRYRFLNFSINTSKNFFKHESDPFNEAELKRVREDSRKYLAERYGVLNFEKKFERWLIVPNPPFSVIHEHTQLLQDIEDAFVLGSYYAALTGACCLGERIYNHIILNIKDFYKNTECYKEVYDRETIIKWETGIGVLKSWGILSETTESKYKRLSALRTNSVHFQNKSQDIVQMAEESIKLINNIVSDLFGIDRDKPFILWFDVPGELYLKKDYEDDPFVKTFYMPAAINVGYQHTIVSNGVGQNRIKDFQYEDKQISDMEFVKLRNKNNNLK